MLDTFCTLLESCNFNLRVFKIVWVRVLSCDVSFCLILLPVLSCLILERICKTKHPKLNNLQISLLLMHIDLCSKTFPACMCIRIWCPAIYLPAVIPPFHRCWYRAASLPLEFAHPRNTDHPALRARDLITAKTFHCATMTLVRFFLFFWKQVPQNRRSTPDAFALARLTVRGSPPPARLALFYGRQKNVGKLRIAQSVYWWIICVWFESLTSHTAQLDSKFH